jgi:hypothetical protein
MALPITQFFLYLLLTLLASSSTAKAQEWRADHGGSSVQGRVGVRVASRRRAERPSRWAPSPSRSYSRGRGRSGHIFRQAARRHRHGPTCRMVGGVYEERPYEVWVPGFHRRVWVPARYDHHQHHGVTRRPTQAGHWRTVHEPGRYETRYRRVWVPRRYVCGGHGLSAY